MSINIKKLNKFYKKTQVIKDLDLSIPQSSIFGLLGPNGAGKTTLISILNYLEKKNSGDISILGYEYESCKKAIKSFSSYIPQNYAFYPELTVYENLEFFCALYKVESNKMKERINEAISMTALENFKNKKSKSFSGGLKRRLNIAIGLLNTPQVLYLDEPTVGIDPQSRKYILDIIKQINIDYKTTIIYTSHYMDEVEYLCDEIAILDQQTIVNKESKENILRQNNNLKIKFDDSEIIIDVNDGYEKLIDIFQQIKKENKKILSIDTNSAKLEEMFFNITKKELRD